MINPVLSVNNLSKFYFQGGKQLQIFNNINLSIYPGEVIALLGPSGSGKSTLLNILGMLDNCSNGDLYIKNHHINKLSQEEKTKLRGKEIGFVFQFHHLLQDFSALENVILPQIINNIDEKQALKIAKQLLNDMGLSSRLSHIPSMLSGGEQQRVSIARAVSTSPSILIADEPTGNLDKNTAKDVFDLLLNIGKQFNIAIIFATHDLSLVNKADRKFTLDQFNLVEFN